MQNKLRMELQKIVEEAYKEKKYRPCVVAILINKQGQILVVQSNKNPQDWSFPQGGINANEDIESALIREVHEETGIKGDQLSNIEYIKKFTLDAEPERKNKRGFSKGKLYFFFRAHYSGDHCLALNQNELMSYKWIVKDVFDEATKTTREEKRAMMRSML